MMAAEKLRRMVAAFTQTLTPSRTQRRHLRSFREFNYYVRLTRNGTVGVGYGRTLYGARAAAQYDLSGWVRARNSKVDNPSI